MMHYIHIRMPAYTCTHTPTYAHISSHKARPNVMHFLAHSLVLHFFFICEQLLAILPLLKAVWRRSWPNSSRYLFLRCNKFLCHVLCKANQPFLGLLLGLAPASLKTLIPKPHSTWRENSRISLLISGAELHQHQRKYFKTPVLGFCFVLFILSAISREVYLYHPLD